MLKHALVLFLFISTQALAETPTSYSFGDVRSNIRAGYDMDLSGPTIKSLSGNTTGTGTNITIFHYFGLGYKLPGKWAFGAKQPLQQTIDDVPTNATNDPLVVKDPYFTIVNNGVLGSEKYGTNLVTALRYYAPFSRATSKEVNAVGPNDQGNGAARFTIVPTKTWLDGDISLALASFIQYRLASNNDAARATRNNGNPHRNDMIFVFNPTLTYSFTKEISAYLEYGMDMNHNTNGKWTQYKASDYLLIGGYFQATKRLMLNPTISAPPASREFKTAALGLFATYKFL